MHATHIFRMYEYASCTSDSNLGFLSTPNSYSVLPHSRGTGLQQRLRLHRLAYQSHALHQECRLRLPLLSPPLLLLLQSGV